MIQNIIILAACVSNLSGGTGDWDTAATWTSCGGGVPGAGDTVSITAGDTVEISGNVAYGTGVASVSTCELSISGDLVVETSPGANIAMTADGTLCVKSGGKFIVGDYGIDEFDCDYYFELTYTTASNKYYLYVESGGVFETSGCVGYPNSSGTIQRARIQSCSPDCDAGSITITLDADVNWRASASLYRPSIVIGVGGDPNQDPSTHVSEEITSWTSPASNQISVTTSQDHEVGDIVMMNARNVIITSSDTTNQSKIYSIATDGYEINWMRAHEMGYGTTTNSAIGCNTSSFGAARYVAITDTRMLTTTVNGFYIYRQATTFTNNSVWLNSNTDQSVCFDVRGTAGYYAPYTIEDCTCVGGDGNGRCLYGAATTRTAITYDGLWCSDLYGHNTVIIGLKFVDCLFHKAATNFLLHTGGIYGEMAGRPIEITGSEFYWGPSGDECINIEFVNNMIFANNNIHHCGHSCLAIDGFHGRLRLYNNTYDDCNNSNSAHKGGIEIGQIAGIVNSGEIYSQDESFGTGDPNYRANIVANYFGTATTTTSIGPVRLTFINTILTTPTNETSSWPILMYTADTDHQYAIMKEGSVFAFHNVDQVPGVHEGFAHNTWYERTTSVTCGAGTNVSMHLMPLHALYYGHIQIGKIFADSGDTVTATIQLRKSTTQSTGSRPRLALEGCGFEITNDYNEMSDVDNTWELVTVSGTATYTGLIRVYVQVRNNLAGGDSYTPVWPPAIDVYADCLTTTVN